jgi:hypothetical protein
MAQGGIAQLVERRLCTAVVSGSTPLTSTKIHILMLMKNLEYEFLEFLNSRNEEFMGDTLAFRSDEGRDYRRNASGSWK